MIANNYFYSNVTKTLDNKKFLEELCNVANNQKQQVYVVAAPLSRKDYTYDDPNLIIVLSPKKKIIFLTADTSNEESFEVSKEDVIEDINSMSDKYSYRTLIGRPRTWKDLFDSYRYSKVGDVDEWFNNKISVEDHKLYRILDLLISLFIGSINDVKNLKAKEPDNLLDKVKQKIQLFDGQQTRFIYEELDADSKRITIQGLSGTGKTELLLHKLRDLYLSDPKATFCFTCYNKILANSMRSRIPEFFNFMKVDQQIDWDRLFCVNAWGRYNDYKSGVYRYICNVYDIEFHSYKECPSFDSVCKKAINDIKGLNTNKFAFTYMFIDESQDFDESFFDLCEIATEKKVFIAGDIFQTIFEERKSNRNAPNFLLSKCYRTDPKTLMFAQAIGMGLFEQQKLWWLDKDQWEQCGYNVEINGNEYTLTREPLRRFEDLDPDFNSLEIKKTGNIVDGIVKLIQILRTEFPTVTPGDIAIIYLDDAKYIYDTTPEIVKAIGVHFNYECDVAYETKKQDNSKVLISNKYNVKGLEYPFVICITQRITKEPSYRNTVYTMLTRSFLRSYLLLLDKPDNGLTNAMIEGGKRIMKDKKMVVVEPSEEQKKEIRTMVKLEKKAYSLDDKISIILKQKSIDGDTALKIKKSLSDLPSNISTDKLENLIATLAEAFNE